MIEDMDISHHTGWGLSAEDEAAREALPQYALPIIIRQEKNTPVDFLSAAQAVATGISTLLGEEKYTTDPAWADPLDSWLRGQFRKVVRRARGAQWDALTTLPHITVQIDDAEVRIIAPHLVGETPQLVHRLQVSGLTLDGARTHQDDIIVPSLKVAVADLGMSDGKMLAQIGHAVQLSILHGLTDEQWYENGSPILVKSWAVQPEDAVTVVDAGLTEIAPGSRTVAAWV